MDTFVCDWGVQPPPPFFSKETGGKGGANSQGYWIDSEVVARQVGHGQLPPGQWSPPKQRTRLSQCTALSPLSFFSNLASTDRRDGGMNSKNRNFFFFLFPVLYFCRPRTYTHRGENLVQSSPSNKGKLRQGNNRKFLGVPKNIPNSFREKVVATPLVYVKITHTHMEKIISCVKKEQHFIYDTFIHVCFPGEE